MNRNHSLAALALGLRSARVEADQTPRFGAYRFDQARALLSHDSGREIRLSRSEANLLAAFAVNPDRVLSREMLLDLARGKDGDPFDRSIDMRIARIRRKIEPDPAHPAILRTVRGAGYIFSRRT